MLELRVATYNVRHCLGRDGVVDPHRTARSIAGLEADLVALQELDRGRTRSGEEDQPAAISAETGLEVFFYPTIDGPDGSYGIALAASQLPAVEVYDLPRVGDEEPRAALAVVLRGVTVISTHLSRHRAARRRQVGYLAGIAEGVRGPVVVAGDLNQGPDGLGDLGAAGLAAPEPPPTFPSHRPRRRIDHVLAGRGAIVTRTETVVTEASDHLPLVATVSVP